jgi:putative heme-binding domain-containing protein
MSLGSATPEQLIAALKSDNLFWRRHAQRLLVERADKTLLEQLLDISVADEPITNHFAAVHARWAVRGITAAAPLSDHSATIVRVNAKLAFQHSSSASRRAALQVALREKFMTDDILEAGLVNDREPQVRLAALLALAESPPHPEASAEIANLLAQPESLADRWLLDAITAAAAAQGERFLTSVAKSASEGLVTPAALERITIVANHVARSGMENPASLLNELKQAQPPVALAIVSGLAAGWPKDKPPVLTPELEASLSEVFENLPSEGKSKLLNLATRWGSDKLQQHVTKIAGDLLTTASAEDQPEEARLAAATQYVEFLVADPAAGELLELITPRTSPELGRGIVEALGKSESAEVGQALAEKLPALTPAVRPAALRVLLARSEWTSPLLKALEEGSVQLADLSLDQKQALADHPDKRIAARAKKLLAAGGGLPNADRQKVLADLLPLAKEAGDATAGKLVFKNQCAKCHTHSGEGAKIGPDLTGMAVHPKHELLVHLIDPSRSVEGNFRVFSVLTIDGLVINGLLASETKTSIELIDAEAKRHVVLREEIENLKASAKSLMPEGFEKQVKPVEIRDLLEFLTQRGQFVPIPLEKYATINSTRGMFYSEDAGAERLIFDDWGPKTFAGVPFQLVDPQGGKAANSILLFGPNGKFPPTMPKSVSLTYSGPAKAIHLLSGVAGWAFPLGEKGSTSLIIRLHYEGGETEDHKLLNGEHFADYIRRVDVPGSQFAYSLRGQQLRYLAVVPNKSDPLAKIELVKGDDATAPIVMAVTVETR